MTFTQYKFPNGHRVPIDIDMPDEIERKARDLVESNWSFEIEINPDTQIVHMDCCNYERALANRICRNGPQVPQKVQDLVNDAHTVWESEGKPRI